MKTKSTAIFLALFLGGIGVHKFYLGKNFQGLMYLFFAPTFIPMILSFFNAIALMMMSDETFERTYNLPLLLLQKQILEKRSA